MDKSELGQNEEEKQESTSSAELSPNETAADESAEQTPSPETTPTEEPVAETSPAETNEAEDPVVAEETTAETDGDSDADAGEPSEEDDSEEAVGASELEDEEPEDDSEEPSEQTSRYRRGDVIEAKITRTSPTAIYFDVDIEGVEGVVPGRELEFMSRKMLDELKEGASVTVFVVNPRDHKGNVLLSINRALEEQDWQQAEEYAESKDVYDGRIAGYNKGGMIVRFGRLRGFLPHSQVGDSRRARMDGETPEERYGQMINEPISVKVMEVDRSRNRLILSERAAMREVRQKRKEDLIGDLEVSEIREGRVVSLEDFGAFVDIGGAEGLVHLTELSWKHVTHPRQILSVGEKVKVKVISVDEDRNRIGLSIRQLKADPWDLIATEYQVGQLVKGKVTKLTKFGAFAQLIDAPAVEGLIHISELSEQRVNHPREVVQKNDELTLRVVKIDVKNRRLGLSLKRVNSAEFLDFDLEVSARADEADDDSAEAESES